MNHRPGDAPVKSSENSAKSAGMRTLPTKEPHNSSRIRVCCAREVVSSREAPWRREASNLSSYQRCSHGTNFETAASAAGPRHSSKH
jgi:hypothetical protein